MANVQLSTLGSVIKTAYEAEADTNAFTDANVTTLGTALQAGGTVALTANWDVGAFTIQGTQFISDIAIGTAPFVVTSTTVVANLNASFLEGNAASAFATAAQGSTADTALQSETSHADVLVDGDFGSSGLMTTDGAGGYSITTNGSANWDTAYGWGNHASGGYLTSASIDTLAELNAIVVDATLIDTGDSRLSDARTPTAHAHEGTAILSTGEVGGTKFLREDGDNSSSWQAVPAPEGTSVLSTGEVGGTKVLTENGAGGATWAAPAGGGAFSADAQTQITPSTAIVLDEATGDEDALRIDYTTNKATSGDDTGLVVNQTDTASPGTSLLADFQVGGTSEYKFEPGSLYFKNDSNMRISASTTTFSYVANTSHQFYAFASNATLTPSFTFSYGGGVSLNRSSSVQNFMRLKPVIAQSGTAGYNAILVDVTETSTGSGASNLIDLQVGGVSKASIDNAGKWSIGGGNSLISETATDTIGFDFATYGTYWKISRTRGIWSSIAAGKGPLLRSEYPTATVPTVCPREDDSDTGLGRGAGVDQLSLIAGGVEGIRVTEANSYINTDLKGGTNAETSGTFAATQITPTYNQASGTAANTDLLINRTETAVGSGDQLLADFQVGGVSKASIDNAGLATLQTLNVDPGGNNVFRVIENIDSSTNGIGIGTSRIVITGGGAYFASGKEIKWASDATIATSGRDTGLKRDSAGVVKVTDGSTGGGKLISKDVESIAGDEAAGNIGALTSIKSAIATVSSSAAATLTATSLIPAGCFMIGLTARITTTFGNSTGLTSFDIGDGADVDRWGAAIAITSGTTVDITNATAATHGSYAAANNVVLTANGGNFDATGVIELLIHYISLTAPTG